jgi:hypothetical protein
VELQLIEQTGPDHLSQQIPTSRDRHVLAARRRAGLLDGALNAVGDEREGRATLSTGFPELGA